MAAADSPLADSTFEEPLNELRRQIRELEGYPEESGHESELANLRLKLRDVIAAGNLGCMTQLASGTGIAVVHTAELLDWATGGPRPEGLPAPAQ
jgi:Fe-S oxidoreductase